MEIKFNCSNPNCRQRISVEAERAGQSVNCPACGTGLHVPESATIKFNCRHCGQHIAVDVAEAGRFARCPSCGKAAQVPGDPLKPLVEPMASDRPVLSSQPVEESAQKRFEFSSLPPLRRIFWGWGLGATIVVILLGAMYLRSMAMAPQHWGAMLNEVFVNDRIVDSPVANHSDTTLLYAQEQLNGVGVFLQDLKTLERTEIRGMSTMEIQGKKIFRLFGWSPDDRYLAFADATTVTNGGNIKKYQEIVICDGSSGAIKTSFNMPSSDPRPELGLWVNTNSLAILNYSHRLVLFNLTEDKNLGLRGKQGLVPVQRLDSGGAYSLTRLSDDAVAYVDKGNVWTFDIPTGGTKQLTHFSDATIEWLDYSPETGKFLFCMNHGADVTNRFVYELRPGSSAGPVQLTDGYSLKGQWLTDGNGFACVRTKGEKSWLAIQSGNKDICTNVFADGSIRAYGISSHRDKIYAVASLRYKAQSIWEYDIFNKSSRDLLAQEGKSVSSSKIIMPVSASTKDKNGDAVEYYFVPPANLVSSKKYPAMFDLYPVNRYDQNAQILADAGIFYVSANRLGLNDWQSVAKAEATLAIYEQLLKNPNIDPKRIYIGGRSFSTTAVSEMADHHVELWRGIILFSPVSVPHIAPGAGNYPSLFIAVGDEDQAALQEQCKQLWLDASARSISARIHFEHAGHGFTVSNYKGSYGPLVKFIRSDY
jgi:hypothetical protein